MHRPGPSTYSRSNSPAPSAGGSTGSGRPGTVRRGGRGGGGGYGGGSLWKQRRGGRRGHSTAFASYGSSAGSTSARAESVISQHQQDAAPTLAGRIDALDHAEDEGAPVGGRIQLVGADEEWITCVSEARSSGSRIVGVAAFQPSTASCVLTQLSDSQTYIKTVHTLSVRWPSVIITPSSSGLNGGRTRTLDPASKSKLDETLLLKTLQSTFGRNARGDDGASDAGSSIGLGRGMAIRRPASSMSFRSDARGGGGVDIEGISRRFFDGEAGLEFVGELILQDDETTSHINAMTGKHYALAAASALFKFLEMSRDCVFAPKSLKIKYCPLEGTMLIDSESAKNLELVENVVDKNSKESLFGFLNHCFTPMATRLLRTNILSPLTEASIIDTRLDVVAELIADEECFKMLRRALKGLHGVDADKITGSIMSATSLTTGAKTQNRRNLDPAKESEKKLGLIIQLRTYVKALPIVCQALEDSGGCKSAMLNTMAKILQDERLQIIDEEISSTLNENVLNTSAKTALSARTSRVFAIKAEKKKLLDVARETYRENIADVDELLKELQNKYPDELDDVALAYNTVNGFTFTLASNILEDKGGQLPNVFTRLPKKTAKKVVFTCVDLIKRNQRISQSLDEIFLLSSDVLDELLLQVRSHVAALYRTSEIIAMLDMLAAFAHVALTSSTYTRPEFTDTLAIREGRHPVMERYTKNPEGFVPNDTYASDAASFNILSGPNMSGKTTFLKQVAMLVVMSQIGSFVPAEFASFKIHNALLTRLSNDDSIEGNLSTFALEMKTMAMILSGLSACDNCLVIIDELGRGTSPQEGTAISHAISEQIIKSTGTYCFFATHFHDLSLTLSMYPNVVSLHLDIEMADAPNPNSITDPNAALKDFSMSFSHRVKDGVTTSTNYGIEIAKAAALPDFMMQEAKKASDKLSALHELRKEGAKGTVMAMRRKKMLEATQALKQAFRSSRLTDAQLYAFIDDNIHRPMVEFLTANMPDQENDGEDEEEMDPEHNDNEVMVDDARTLARNTSYNSGRFDEDAIGQRAGPYRQHTPVRSRSASVSYVYELSPRPGQDDVADADVDFDADADVSPAQRTPSETRQHSPALQQSEAAALPEMMEAIPRPDRGQPDHATLTTGRYPDDEHNHMSADVNELRKTASQASTVHAEAHDEPMKESVRQDAFTAMYENDDEDQRRRSPSSSGMSHSSDARSMQTAVRAAGAAADDAAHLGQTGEVDMLDDEEVNNPGNIEEDHKAGRRSRSATILDGGSLESTQALRAQEWAANRFSNEAGHKIETDKDDSEADETEIKMVDIEAVTAKLEAGLGSPMSAQDEDDEDDDIEDLLLAVKPEEKDSDGTNVKYEKAESMEAEGRFNDATAGDE